MDTLIPYGGNSRGPRHGEGVNLERADLQTKSSRALVAEVPKLRYTRLPEYLNILPPKQVELSGNPKSRAMNGYLESTCRFGLDFSSTRPLRSCNFFLKAVPGT